jgi:hypothetical protein
MQPQDCTATNSIVTHTATGRTFRYGELAGDAAKITLAKEPAIKTPDQYMFIGKSMPRIDVPPKTNGSAKFAIDTQLPDMVFAAINACPVPGGKLKSVDDSPLAATPGVLQVVRLPDAVAVVATGSFWRAKQALAKLHPEWDVGDAGTAGSAQFAREYHAALDGPAEVARDNGNVDEALPKAAKTLEAVYETPYLAHASMEPMNATVHFQADRLDIWIGTQAANETIENAARVSGLNAEQIYIHNCFIGGGFGRKSANDEMVQAIAIAKAVQRPVKLIWTREEDMRRDRFRPQAVTRFKAGLDANGMPVAWSMRNVIGSIFASLGIHRPGLKGPEPMAVAGLANNAYNVPNTRVDAVLKNTHLPVMFWRAPGENQNIFALESFVAMAGDAVGEKERRARLLLLAAEQGLRGRVVIVEGRLLRGRRQRLQVRGHRVHIVVAQIGSAVVDDVEHRTEGNGSAVVAGPEEGREIALRPSAKTGALIAAQVGRKPRVELCAFEIGAAAIVERFLLKRPAARRVAGAAMAQPFDEIGTAVPGGVMLLARNVGATLREHRVPDGERPAEAQIAWDLARLVRLFDRRHLLYEEVVERAHVVVGDLGIGRVRHGGIEPVPVLGDALPHGAVEILERVVPDAIVGIGRDVGRIDGAERRPHLEAARERLAAGHGMASDAIAGARHVFAFALGRCGLLRMRERGRAQHEQGYTETLHPPQIRPSQATGRDP